MKVAKSLQDTITLHNGQSMPQLGLGVYKMTDEIEANFAIQSALKIGYRLIDTASLYENEQVVGAAVKESDVSREEIFITSKVWNSDQGYDHTLRAFEESLKKLQTDYMDLYLIHWPGKDSQYKDTWRALERLYNEGTVKAVGVCNFQVHHLKELMASSNEKPVINQVENHPMLTQEELRTYCRENDIAIEAWAPIARNQLANEPVLTHLARKHGKSVSQVILRWHLQNGTVIIPKSVNRDRIRENSEIFDFELSQEEMNRISGLNKDERLGPNPDEFFKDFK